MACELYCAANAVKTAGIGFRSSLLSLCSHDSAIVAAKNEIVFHQWTLPSADERSAEGSLSCPIELESPTVTTVATLPCAFNATEVVSIAGMTSSGFAVGSACGKVWVGGLDTVTASVAELGHCSIADPTAGPAHTHLSRSAGGVFAAAHSSSKCARLLGMPPPGSKQLHTPFATQLADTVTCVAAIHAPAIANAPVLAAGCAQLCSVWDSRAAGVAAAGSSGQHAKAAASLSPTSGALVHARWCGEWGVTGGLVTMSDSGLVELWEPRTWRVAEQWRAPAKYSTQRLAASADAKFVWSTGTDNDVLAGQLALGELGAAGDKSTWKVARGGAGLGREVNRGGYTGPVDTDKTPDRIKEGRRKGFHGGARWGGGDVLQEAAGGCAAADSSPQTCTLAALTERGQLYIVRHAHAMS
jgi:hypothetical protein